MPVGHAPVGLGAAPLTHGEPRARSSMASGPVASPRSSQAFGAEGGGRAAMVSGPVSVADRSAGYASSRTAGGTAAAEVTQSPFNAPRSCGQTTSGRAAVPRPTLANCPTRPSLVHSLRARPLRARCSTEADAQACSPTVISSPVASAAPPEPPVSAGAPAREEPLSPTRTAVPLLAPHTPQPVPLPVPHTPQPVPHTPPPVSTDPPPVPGASGEFLRLLRPARGKLWALVGSATLALGVGTLTMWPEESRRESGQPRSHSAPLAPAPFQAEPHEGTSPGSVRSEHASEQAPRNSSAQAKSKAARGASPSAAARPRRAFWSGAGPAASNAAAAATLESEEAAGEGRGERAGAPLEGRSGAAPASSPVAEAPAQGAPSALGAESGAAARAFQVPGGDSLGEAPAAPSGEGVSGTGKPSEGAAKARRPLPGSGL